MPTLRELRGSFNQERVSYGIIAKAAKSLRRLQIQLSNHEDSWGVSASDIDAPIHLPHLKEVIVHIADGVSVGLHPRHFTAFYSLDSFYDLTMNIPKNLRAFIMALVAFVRICEGSPVSQTPKPPTIRIGEASLKPQISFRKDSIFALQPLRRTNSKLEPHASGLPRLGYNSTIKYGPL